MTVDTSLQDMLTAAMKERHSGGIAGGGGGPHDPGMNARVTTLEADMKGMTATLSRIETTLAVVAEGMKAVATKADLATLSGTVTALSTRTDGLAGRVDKIERTVDSKVLGPWQLPAILASCVGIGLAGVALYNWLVVHLPAH